MRSELGCDNYSDCYSLVSVGVLVSFFQATYVADENQATVEVCLSLSGQLDRDLNVTISTITDTAMGKFPLVQT